MLGMLNEELFEGKGKEVFNKYKPTIEKVIEDRVFSVDGKDGEFRLTENCDDWFSTKLTPEVCDKLAGFFSDLSKYMSVNR